MPRKTKESDQTLENNLEYIGLNLSKAPNFLKQYESLNFRPSKSYDETVYKVYKYINIKEIQILITPCDRLTDIKERYKLASPIVEYLDSKSEDNIEKFATFLKMVSTMKKDRIEEIAKEQEMLNSQIPYEVKYPNNYIWQIYYSDVAKKYFMLVPTNEQDNNALFYLLKEQIANVRARKPRFIFAPVSHLEYSGAFLTKSEIADMENYLWYFTKEWPNIYEVYDKQEEMFLKIVGVTNIYEKMQSTYSITLDTKKKATELYKLLKAMFILATGAKEEYHFITKINQDGEIEFWNNNAKIEYEKFSEFIKLEYLDKIDKLKYEQKEKKELKRKVDKFKIVIEDLTQEYLLKQRQIATFLECKKSFFGRVRYFFKKKKDDQIEKKPVKQPRTDEEKDNSLNELFELKEQYTIEDLISICTKLEELKKENTNLELDLNAIETKEEILSKKVDNAELYIKEIDKHKKSIFEFWKFTKKDEVATLNEGEGEEGTEKVKMKKYFDYIEDLEKLGQKMDELQRRKLSKNETDALFAIRQVPESFRELEKEKETSVEVYEQKDAEEVKKKSKKISPLEKDLEQLKEEYEKDIEVINAKDFDIFGNLVEDKTKVKSINNVKHREIEKDKYKVLNINSDTDIKLYVENLESYFSLIKEALNKIQSPYDMSVYCINSKKGIEGINIFDINPETALKNELDSKKSKIILCRINIKENTPALFYTNIMFYDNFNKTLPVGMNLSTEVLVDVNKLKLDFKGEETFYINHKENEFDFTTKEVKLYEYEALSLEERKGIGCLLTF